MSPSEPAGRELRAERRMTDVEALMWNLEKDPHLRASMAMLTTLDRPPDRDRLWSRIERAVATVPRLHQKVVPALGRLAPPEWRVDPDFDLANHLRWVALPAPATMRELLDLTSSIVHDPFDRTRPLWEFVVVEGLEGGRAAMVQKLHHAITDGKGGVRLSEQFIDLERDATEPMSPARPSPEPLDAGLLATTTDTLTHNLRRGLGVARRGAQEAAGLARHPQRLVGLGRDAADLAASALRQAAVTDPARSSLWTERTLRRRIEVLRVPFEPAKRAAKDLGGTLNDLFVCAAAGGAGAYHRAAGFPVDQLRISMPVSTRSDRTAGGNAFTPARVLVSAGIEDPRERFAVIREELAATRHERALGAADAFAGLANLLPTSLVVRLARQQVETVDFAASNVRGAPFPLYLAGARMDGNFPIGPIGGTAWNLTLMTYDGHLDMGLNVDAGAVADPEGLRDAIAAEFDRLLG
jgi:WS/DGAT/MGAT family acyltransferase